MSEDVIDFDGDAVTLNVRGQSVHMLAADVVDEVLAEIVELDKAITDEQRASGECPDWEDEFGVTQKFSHGRGDAFLALLQRRFKTKHELDVKPAVAWAIWCKLKQKAKAYQDFFESGSSSRPPSDSPRPTASADEAAAKRLSTTPADSVQPSGLKTSTTASVTPSTESAT